MLRVGKLKAITNCNERGDFELRLIDDSYLCIGSYVLQFDTRIFFIDTKLRAAILSTYDLVSPTYRCVYLEWKKIQYGYVFFK